MMQKSCLTKIQYPIRSTYPSHNIPIEWVNCFDLLQQLKPKLLRKIVKWDKQDEGWVKCNKDGLAR